MSLCQFSAVRNQGGGLDSGVPDIIVYTYKGSGTTPNPSLYGLNSFNISINYTSGTGNEINAQIILSAPGIPNPTTYVFPIAIINTDSVTITSISNSQNGNFVAMIEGTGNNFNIKTTNVLTFTPPLRTGVTWNLTLDENTNTLMPIMEPAGCPLSVDPQLNIEILPLAPLIECETIISGVASTTPDGQELSQVKYTILNPYPCQCGVEISYTKYCPDVTSVLKGRGCTYAQKINSLGLSIDSVTQYSMVRMILSQLLYGCFDSKYLLQRYYCKFFKDVKRLYPNYKEFFDGSNPKYPYGCYFKLFHK